MDISKVTSLSLKDFRNKISDLARPNRFEVQITPPTEYEWGDVSLLSWTAETAQIPSRTQGEIKIKFHGMELKLPGDYERENLTIGFINTYGWEGRSFFDTWMETIQAVGDINSREAAFSMLYGTRIRVHQLGRGDNDILASYEFYDVFPTNISTIDLNMGEYDSFEKFTVSFAYSYFVALEVEQTYESQNQSNATDFGDM